MFLNKLKQISIYVKYLIIVYSVWIFYDVLWVFKFGLLRNSIGSFSSGEALLLRYIMMYSCRMYRNKRDGLASQLRTVLNGLSVFKLL